MTFGTLALIAAIGLIGPLLAWREEWRIPVVIGELVAGLVLGATGARLLDATEPTFHFLAEMGFALAMFEVGSHVPLRDRRIRAALGSGALLFVVVAIASVGIGVAIAALTGTTHSGIYAVLIASSSAALVLPIVESLRLGGPAVMTMTAQVAIADVAAIVALPLVVVPDQAGRAAVGALVVVGAAGVIYIGLIWGQQNGTRRQVQVVSKKRAFALELRVDLVLLFALAALAVAAHISVLLAGFALGLAVAGVGEPRRLAHQIFAVSDGFLAPLFFVWLGASLDLSALGSEPRYWLLGLALAVGAVVAHGIPRALGQPWSLGMLASAQLGVPAAVATLGTQTGVLDSGEAAAVLCAAVASVAVSALAGRSAARSGLTA